MMSLRWQDIMIGLMVTHKQLCWNKESLNTTYNNTRLYMSTSLVCAHFSFIFYSLEPLIPDGKQGKLVFQTQAQSNGRELS